MKVVNYYFLREIKMDLNNPPEWIRQLTEFYLDHSTPEQKKEFRELLRRASSSGVQLWTHGWGKIAWLREERMGMIDWEGDPQLDWRDRERIAFGRWQADRAAAKAAA